jgi:hypothetical protein
MGRMNVPSGDMKISALTLCNKNVGTGHNMYGISEIPAVSYIQDLLS